MKADLSPGEIEDLPTELWRWMARNNVTLAALADKLDMHEVHVGRLRRGEITPPVSTMKLIERVTREIEVRRASTAKAKRAAVGVPATSWLTDAPGG